MDFGFPFGSPQKKGLTNETPMILPETNCSQLSSADMCFLVREAARKPTKPTHEAFGALWVLRRRLFCGSSRSHIWSHVCFAIGAMFGEAAFGTVSSLLGALGCSPVV